jgi:hypothetical protein
MCRQPQQRDATLPSRGLNGTHQLAPEATAPRLRGDADALDLGSMVGIRGTTEDELGHPEDLFIFLGHEQKAIAVVQRRNDVTVRALEDTLAHRLERSEGHPGPQSVVVHLGKACADVVRLRRCDAANAEQLVGYGSPVEVVGPFAS